MLARMGEERKREQRRQENRHDHADREQWMLALRVLVYGW
jgi:hypothetical protein